MFHFKRGKQQELSEKEAKRVNEKFNSFKNKKYSEDDMNKVFENEETILHKMDNKYLNGFIEDVKLYFSMLKDFFTKKMSSGSKHAVHKINVAVCVVIQRGDYDVRMLHGNLIEQMRKRVTDNAPLDFIVPVKHINYFRQNGWQRICFAGFDFLFRDGKHFLVVANQKAQDHICIDQRHGAPPSFSTAAF